MDTDIGVGITGIAGPGGGSEEKPVGLVYISVADEKHTVTKKFEFGNLRRSRERIRGDAAGSALDMIRKILMEEE